MKLKRLHGNCALGCINASNSRQITRNVYTQWSKRYQGVSLVKVTG